MYLQVMQLIANNRKNIDQQVLFDTCDLTPLEATIHLLWRMGLAPDEIFVEVCLDHGGAQMVVEAYERAQTKAQMFGIPGGCR